METARARKRLDHPLKEHVRRQPAGSLSSFI
jgi:hypothetical protein